jgi:hypothetical protein
MVLGLAVAGHGEIEVAPAVAAARHDEQNRRTCRQRVIVGQVDGCRYLPAALAAVG